MKKLALLTSLALMLLMAGAKADPFASLFSFNMTNGHYPNGALVSDGTALYGTTIYGGHLGNGVVFKMNLDGSGYTLLRDFTNSPDGANPYCGLALSGSTLYGVCNSGGNASNGVIFKVNTDGSGYGVMMSFPGGSESHPVAPLTVADGVLYGSTQGVNGSKPPCHVGTLFRINTDGSGYKVLKDFDANPDEGVDPSTPLIVAGDTLYGACWASGLYNPSSGDTSWGTVFKIGTNGGGFSVLKTFTSRADGLRANGDVALANGVFYGTTAYGGDPFNFGVLYKINTDGSGFAVLKSFGGSNGSGPDGETPYSGVTLAGDKLYGTTFTGGDMASGTVYSVGTNGNNYAIVKSFLASDGAFPSGGLLLVGHTLYGTTTGGGNGDGTIFAVTLPAPPAIAQSFDATKDFSNTNGNPNGAWSYGYMPAGFGSLTLYTNASTSDQYQSWWVGIGAPGLWKNVGAPLDVQPSGWLALHPGPAYEPSVLRWTAPKGGVVSVQGEFLPGDIGYMQVGVLLNTQLVWHAGNNGNFRFQTNVLAGDTIDFTVYDGYYYGTTPVSAVVSYAIPPLTIVAAGGSVTVSWPEINGFTLMQTANLAPANWTASGGVTTSNGTNYLILTNPAGNLFFQLKQ